MGDAREFPAQGRLMATFPPYGSSSCEKVRLTPLLPELNRAFESRAKPLTTTIELRNTRMSPWAPSP